MEENRDEMQSEWEELNKADERTFNARNELFVRLLRQNEELKRENYDLDEDLKGRKLRNAELAKVNTALSAQLQNLQLSLKAYEQEDVIAICLIDGDGAVFNDDLLRKGQDGGAEAARQLKEGLLKHISETEGIRPRDTKAMIFMNVTGLGWALERHGICNGGVFRQFILGFNQATPLFAVVDVGNGKEAADAKLRENLLLFSRFRQTRYMFFAGAHDGGYIPTLKSMQNEGNIHKMTILEGYAQTAFEARKFIEDSGLGITSIPGLFRQEKLENNSTPMNNASRSEVVSPVFGSSSVAESEAGDVIPSEQGGSTDRANNGTPIIRVNFKKPLRYQVPPLCNFHYLVAGGCPRGTACTFSHAYVLTPKQLVQYRKEIKAVPCTKANMNKACPLKDNCFAGHYCPSGPSCPKKANGQCNWKGRKMHDARP
ncbi:hypothetical protein FRB95_001282 [Tulasnella sp. JGI-2019a]|nr:hypothetical protein FRB95_001282 [Tulasnella sp. JGI-2019a]